MPKQQKGTRNRAAPQKVCFETNKNGNKKQKNAFWQSERLLSCTLRLLCRFFCALSAVCRRCDEGKLKCGDMSICWRNNSMFGIPFGTDWHLIARKSVCCKACNDGRNFLITKHVQTTHKHIRAAGRWSFHHIRNTHTPHSHNMYLSWAPNASAPNNIYFVLPMRRNHDVWYVLASRSKSIRLFSLYIDVTMCSTFVLTTVCSSASLDVRAYRGRHLATSKQQSRK